jgi:hypothetical protein
MVGFKLRASSMAAALVKNPTAWRPYF